jgi:drug/metabolite transporter (DMT)-like permease
MLARIAPLGFILLWSSAFIAVRAGLVDVTALYYLFLRFALAGATLALAMLALRQSWRPLAGRWYHLAFAGALMNTVYLSAAYYALARVSGAIIALIGALNPLLTALLAGPVLGERFSRRQWLGIALGVLGVAMVVGVRASEGAAEFVPMLVSAVGILALVAGTLYHGRYGRGVPLLPANAVQMSAAALTAGVLMLVLETPHADWTPSAIGWLLWLTFAVSIGGMGLFLYMMKTGTAGKVAANFYLTPGVTAVMGWLMLGETLSPLAVVGLLVASAGVWLVQSSR